MVNEQGSVTAEFALALPCVIVLFSIIVNFMNAGTQRLELIDAAGVLAREAAAEVGKGLNFADIEASLVSQKNAILGNDCESSFSIEGKIMRVTLRKPLQIGPISVFPAKISGEAVWFLGDLVEN